MDFKIINVKGHIEVFDGKGRFLFSADSEAEARDELQNTDMLFDME